MQAISEQKFLPGLCPCFRIPEGDDVVVRLVDGGQFHQLDRAFTPPGSGLDPQAWAPLIKNTVVLVVVEIAVALKQAEAARILVAVCIESDGRGIGERPPDPFAAPVYH